jgi:hypothetical protein
MAASSIPPKRHAPWRGRPRVKEAKIHPFTIRLTGGQRAELIELAERAGVSRGAFARAVLLGSPPPRSARRPPRDVRELARLFGEIGKIGSNVNQLAHHANITRALPAIGELQAINFHLMQMHEALMRALGQEP